MGTGTPDEFRVVRKAPLTIPPDYNLHPPKPGESRPQELEPDAQARVALFGQDFGKNASEGEKLLVKQAGGDTVDRTVRSEVDYDSAQILRKSNSFADEILNFGRKPSAAVVDPATEAARLKTEEADNADLTGDQPVIIKRKSSGKLPGL
ncbi:MAG: DUF3035 domain-containing protein [Alphaproteobacteria bacterium]|nr:DUF3035 domain-containing protein [Alphaproteobacteria bacterium]